MILMRVGNSYDYQIIGDSSEVLVENLFNEFTKVKRKGYIWKFKNVDIPGLEEPVTLQIHQGMHGITNHEGDSSYCKNGSYFTTFTSEKYRQKRLTNQKPNEKLAVLVYIKRGRKFAIVDYKEAKLVEEYLNDFMK